jgi:hypothetical protein
VISKAVAGVHALFDYSELLVFVSWPVSPPQKGLQGIVRAQKFSDRTSRSSNTTFSFAPTNAAHTSTPWENRSMSMARDQRSIAPARHVTAIVGRLFARSGCRPRVAIVLAAPAKSAA